VLIRVKKIIDVLTLLKKINAIPSTLQACSHIFTKKIKLHLCGPPIIQLGSIGSAVSSPKYDIKAPWQSQVFKLGLIMIKFFLIVNFLKFND